AHRGVRDRSVGTSDGATGATLVAVDAAGVRSGLLLPLARESVPWNGRSHGSLHALAADARGAGRVAADGGLAPRDCRNDEADGNRLRAAAHGALARTVLAVGARNGRRLRARGIAVRADLARLL